MKLLSLDKLKYRMPEIIAAAVRATRPIADVQTCAVPSPAAERAMAPPPQADSFEWRPLRQGERWGVAPGADPEARPASLGWGIPTNGGSLHWLRVPLRVPEEWRGQAVLLAVGWNGVVESSLEAVAAREEHTLAEEHRREVLLNASAHSGQASLEGIVYLDGQALAGIDDFHRAVLLPAAAHEGEHEVLIRCYVPFAQRFGGLTLQLRDEAIFRLGQAMRAMLGAVETYRDSDPERHALLERLDAAYNALDLREGWQSQRFAESARAAIQELGVGSWELGISSPTPNSQLPTPTIIATGHAHLDVAWLWPLWRTRQKVAHTVATALHLMDRYPNYRFSMSQPQVYAFLEQDDAELYARMKERVAEGRFEPVGMMWLEPDCNVTGGESLIRQLLYGARFFAEAFGEINHIVWLPDVFGYSAALPQLLRGCGITCFMTTKISWSQFNRMPYDTFRWRGIDGSEVLTHFVTTPEPGIPHYTYVGRMQAYDVFGCWDQYRQKDLNSELLYIYGWGDGGGGPTEQMLEATQVFQDLPGFPQVRQGRIDQFFERLYERVWDDPRLPTWVGELYLEYHRGTYTSQGRTKQANRAAELRYREAEWLNAWATTLGALSRQEDLDAGWKLILLNQFHDILPGSSVPQVYVDSNAQYAEVTRIAGDVRDAAAAAVLSSELRVLNLELAQSHPASQLHNAAYVLFNSLPWQRRDHALIELSNSESAPILLDSDGNPLISQLIEERSGESALLVEATVPSYGYAILMRAPGAREATTRNSKLITHNSKLENDELRLELDDDGEIASLYDKRAAREVIAPGAAANRLVAYEDRPLQWDAWDIDIFYEEKPYPVREILDWRVVEEGPLRAAIEITRRVGQSTIRQRIGLWRDSRRVDFVTEVDWQERQTLLRALFPLAINATRATCEIQFGAVERPTHRNTSWDWARFEVCAHKWVDLSEGDYGVALLNDGKYGHSLHHNVLGLSLLKGAIFPDPGADRGLHRFTYSLLPHQGDWRAAQVVRRAYELNVPLRAFPTNEDRGWQIEDSNARVNESLSSILDPRSSDNLSFVVRRSSFLSTSTDHIVVETVKVAQDGDGLIVRLYEAHNQRGRASLVFGRPVASAAEVDLLEREVGAVAVEGAEVRFDVRPFEVKTLRVRFSAERIDKAPIG